MSKLHDLLRLVAEGGVHSYDDLAEKLAVPLPLLGAMLEDLGRLGYLRPAEATCGKNCQSCPIGGCSVAGRSRLWVLTEKGAQAAT